MRIQHNIASLNSYRQLGSNNNSVAKNLEKLSSGYKINKAGDDAAGLAISEKMRAQIKGLETAQKNANDGISLVQTAEGAMTEVHSMLNRMVELATQSSNGTFDDKVDRANLQKEISSLKEEIDRISESTNFNGINLLDGSLSGGAGIETANAGVKSTVNVLDPIAASQETGEIFKNLNPQTNPSNVKVSYMDAKGTQKSIEVTIKNDATYTDKKKAADALAVELNKQAKGDFTVKGLADGKLSFTSEEPGQSKFQILEVVNNNVSMDQGRITHGKDAEFELKFTGDTVNADFSINGKNFQLLKPNEKLKEGYSGIYISDAKANDADRLNMIITQLKDQGIVGELNANANGIIFKKVDAASSGGLNLQVGDTNADFQKVKVKVGDMSTLSLGISNVSVATQKSATDAISRIKDAINTISSTRGDLGAVQNRLEHTINNLGATTENMTAAESRIRDTDMAKEMMAYTKNNILVQSAQAMLAQANTQPQSVLQLLQ